MIALQVAEKDVHRLTRDSSSTLIPCSLDCIRVEDSSVDTRVRQHPRHLPPRSDSHIVNVPPLSSYAVDTPCIPHLAPSSWISRSRCGMGVGGSCRCACCEIEWCVQVLDWLLSFGLPGERWEPGGDELWWGCLAGIDQAKCLWADRRHTAPPFPWKTRRKHLRFRTERRRINPPNPIQLRPSVVRAAAL